MENEVKKLLEIKFAKIIDNIIDKFIENIFYSNSNNKYQDIMLNIDENARKSILKEKSRI